MLTTLAAARKSRDDDATSCFRKTLAVPYCGRTAGNKLGQTSACLAGDSARDIKPGYIGCGELRLFGITGRLVVILSGQPHIGRMEIVFAITQEADGGLCRVSFL